MKRTYSIGRVFGIAIKLHVSFVIFIGALVLWTWLSQNPVAALAMGMQLCLFSGLVLLHELGHSLMALRNGIAVVDITLLPIGGMARIVEMPADPWAAFKIAVAGPLVNLAIAALLSPMLLLVAIGELGRPRLSLASFIAFLIAINLAMAIFNFLPAFPMDGGRILRALLVRRCGHLRATEIAAATGKWIALALGIAGLLYLHSFWIAIIALYVYSAGQQELAMVRARHRAGGGFPFGGGRRPFGGEGKGFRPPPPPPPPRPPSPPPTAWVEVKDVEVEADSAPTASDAATEFDALARRLDEIRRRVDDGDRGVVRREGETAH